MFSLWRAPQTLTCLGHQKFIEFSSALESIEEQVEKKRNPFNEPKMYLETWKITRCVNCGHIEGKKLLSSEPLT